MHNTLTAIALTALLCLSEPAASAADHSNPPKPQTGKEAAGPSGPAAAVAVLESVKAQYREACTALLAHNDPGTAARLLAALEPEAKRVLALLQGTDLESQVASGLNRLGELRRALEAGEAEQARRIVEELGQLGGSLEPKIRALAPGADTAAPEKVIRLAHVEIKAAGIGDAYANAIARTVEFPCPYYFFQRGDPKWVTIPVKPTRVPPQFIICVGFNPTATRGVFVHHDASGSGSSLLDLPGSKGRPFGKGDWLIRATVQEAKD